MAAAGGFSPFADGGGNAGFGEGGGGDGEGGSGGGGEGGGGGFRLGDTRDTSEAFMRAPHTPAATVLRSTLAVVRVRSSEG